MFLYSSKISLLFPKPSRHYPQVFQNLFISLVSLHCLPGYGGTGVYAHTYTHFTVPIRHIIYSILDPHFAWLHSYLPPHMGKPILYNPPSLFFISWPCQSPLNSSTQAFYIFTLTISHATLFQVFRQHWTSLPFLSVNILSFLPSSILICSVHADTYSPLYLYLWELDSSEVHFSPFFPQNYYYCFFFSFFLCFQLV